MRDTIRYAIDPDTGLVHSYVGGELAVPTLVYDSMSPSNSFEGTYYLGKLNVFDVAVLRWFQNLKWTRKIPLDVKNAHRKFWGMKEIEEKN